MACAATIRPGATWVDDFRKAMEQADVNVCFAPGDYELAATLRVSERRAVKVGGSGGATRITATSAEAAFVFDRCGHVTVRDLAVQSGAVGAAGGEPDLNGTLSFFNCGGVTVDSVGVRCGGAGSRGAACITVRSELGAAAAGRGAVRVRGCDLEVGLYQTGVLIVNQARVAVEATTIGMYAPPDRLGPAELVRSDLRYRSRIRRLLASGLQVGRRRRDDPSFVVRFPLQTASGTAELWVPEALAESWRMVLAASPLPDNVSLRDAAAAIRGHANRAILGLLPATAQPAFTRFLEGLYKRSVPALGQGIVVGGEVAADVRIAGNTISGCIQAIHLGLSLGDVSPSAVIGRAAIRDNTCYLVLPPAARDERHGIFVGAVDSLTVCDNYLDVSAADGRSIDGIRVWGRLGPFVNIVENHLEGFSTGVRLQPLAGSAERPRWRVVQNMFRSSKQLVDRPPDAPIEDQPNFS